MIMNYETAQLVVPLMDVVSRWAMYSCQDKSAALVFLKAAGFEPHELAAIEVFLIALDDNPEDEDDD
jgi:hypothetical protein